MANLPAENEVVARARAARERTGHWPGSHAEALCNEVKRLEFIQRDFHNLDDVIEIRRLNWTLEFAKQAQLTAEAETTKAMAAHAIEVAQLRDEIARLRTAIDQVHNARLTWAMVCPCGCKPCDDFYEFVRDTLPDCSPDDGAGCAVCGEPTPAGRTYCSEICESDATPSSSSVDVST